MRRRTTALEGAYLDFIASTRLGIVSAVCVVAFLVFTIRFGFSAVGLVYTFTMFVPMLLVVLLHRRQLPKLLLGDLDPRKMIQIGLVPIGILLALMFSMIFELHLSYHEPVMHYINLEQTPTFVMFQEPFAEEMIFRLWMQTRLQQYFGLFGAILTGAIFVAAHVAISPWRIIGSIIFTWVRYRYRSLGATLIGHYLYDVGLWAFASFVH